MRVIPMLGVTGVKLQRDDDPFSRSVLSRTLGNTVAMRDRGVLSVDRVLLLHSVVAGMAITKVEN